jgi:MFS family permease
VAAVMLAGQGFSVSMWNVVTVSLRQQTVPAPLLGRVNSVYHMLGWGLMPLGALAGGFVAHAAGLRAPYVVAGVLCGLAMLVAVPVLLAVQDGQRGPGLRNRPLTLPPALTEPMAHPVPVPNAFQPHEPHPLRQLGQVRAGARPETTSMEHSCRSGNIDVPSMLFSPEAAGARGSLRGAEVVHDDERRDDRGA